MRVSGRYGLAAAAWLTLCFPVEAQNTAKQVAIIDHIALQVVDLDASVAFYRDVFGFVAVPAPFPNARWMKTGDGMLLHMVGGRTQPVAELKWSHFALSCVSMEVMITSLNVRKIPWSDINDRHMPQVRPDGVKQIFVRDPNGYWIEVNDALKAN